MLDVFLNGERVEFDEETRLDFSKVTVVKQNQSRVGIYFNSGVSIDTKAIEGFLIYQMSVPKKFKGRYNNNLYNCERHLIKFCVITLNLSKCFLLHLIIPAT